MSENHTRLVAVFEDRRRADDAANEASQVTSAPVRVGESDDYLRALRGEMREEMEHTILAPQAGFIATKESAKGLMVGVPVGAVIGALVALPLAAIPFGGWPVILRLVLVAVIGGVGGATVGFIAGMGTVIRPEDQPAAQRGVVVAVDDDSDALEQILARHEPIRLDRIGTDEIPQSTIVTEDDRNDEGVISQMIGQVAHHPGGDWSAVEVTDDDDPRLRSNRPDVPDHVGGELDPERDANSN